MSSTTHAGVAHPPRPCRWGWGPPSAKLTLEAGALWIETESRRKEPMPESMRGKVVVITGATSGIGRVAAEKLAAMGARMVLVARDPSRADATLARLREIDQAGNPTVHYADLSRLAEMKRVAAEIAATELRIDVLINNAGAMFGHRQVTADGLEMTFAVNHMAYFVLTYGLRQRLLGSAPARVVNTSSNAHKRSPLDFNDLQSARNYSGFMAYSRSKLCNILFTRELARRLAGKRVTANCLHPGFVDTRFADRSGGWFAQLIRLGKLGALSPEKGAETLVYLASSPEVADVTGQYFHKCRPKTPTVEAQDDSAARRLWSESARLAGIEEDWR
jgi:NAD(P)-dependent dehydrogenase (short-subunit alcohol dehydrogenase family)